MNQQRRFQSNTEFIINLISLFLAHTLSIVIFGVIIKRITPYPKNDTIEYIFVLLISAIIVFLYFSVRINFTKRDRTFELTSTLKNCLLTYGLFGAMLILTKNPIIDSRYLFLSSFIFYIFFSLIGRYVFKHYMIKKISKSKFATRVGVISTYDRACEFIPKLKEDWTNNVTALALIDADFNESGFVLKDGKSVFEINEVPVVANIESLIGWIRTASLDEIYINVESTDMLPNANELIEELEDMGITVNINIPALEKIVSQSKYNNLNCVVENDYPIAKFAPTVISPGKLAFKRLVDIIGGIVGTILSLPIILIVAIPLKLESSGPLIFKQQRVGKNGRIFNIYKLRSMYEDAEERKKVLQEQNQMDGHMFKMDNDPRITKVGKFIRKTSIDELPQFWNVLKGDMSLVGTRPPTIDEFEKYESHHKRRLSMKPGITGKWQVSGRSNIKNFEDVVKLDCEYIDEWSPILDIQILIKTVGVVLTHKGAE